MYDASRSTSYPYVGTGAAVAESDRRAILAKVLALVGFAFLFTAGGAVIGMRLNPAISFFAIFVALGALIALNFVREKSPLNLILLYTFATLEGVAISVILAPYLMSSGGIAVVSTAAATTAAVTLAAGAYGYTTKRDVARFSGFLFIGLIGIIVASIVGIFVQLPLLYVGISAIAAILFTGFIVVDLNRVANARGVTEGLTIMLAVSIYLDILNLFLALLRLFGFAAGSSSRD